MNNLWNVILPWAWNGEPGDEEGTYATSVSGADEEEAKRNAATQMADSGEKDFLGDEDERRRYIETRVQGWGEVRRQQDQLAGDLAGVFADELFPQGRRSRIDLRALGRLLAENRHVVAASGSDLVPRQQDSSQAFEPGRLTGLCQPIIDGYAAEKSGLDDDMVPHLVALADEAASIQAMERELLRAHSALRAVLSVFDCNGNRDPERNPLESAALRAVYDALGMRWPVEA